LQEVHHVEDRCTNHAISSSYWFFKVNAGPTALLVDWIRRRRPTRTGSGEPAPRLCKALRGSVLDRSELGLVEKRTRGRAEGKLTSQRRLAFHEADGERYSGEGGGGNGRLETTDAVTST
jgi:hypothetical protein